MIWLDPTAWPASDLSACWCWSPSGCPPSSHLSHQVCPTYSHVISYICNKQIHVQWWFVNPDTFVPARNFRINEFSGLLNLPSPDVSEPLRNRTELFTAYCFFSGNLCGPLLLLFSMFLAFGKAVLLLLFGMFWPLERPFYCFFSVCFWPWKGPFGIQQVISVCVCVLEFNVTCNEISVIFVTAQMCKRTEEEVVPTCTVGLPAP